MKIQKNIPMPVVKPRGKNGTNKHKYPWREMEVGDSFRFPDSVGRAGHAATVHASNTLGKKFQCIKTDGGYRCWRVK